MQVWLPIITVLSDQVFVYIQSVQAYLSPPIFVAYFGGILWPRANANGALSCLGFGYLLGFTRLVLEISFKEECALPPEEGGLSGFASYFICSNFLYFGLISLGFCLVAMVVGSLSTPPPEQNQLKGLTFFSAMAGLREEAARENEVQMDPISLGEGAVNPIAVVVAGSDGAGRAAAVDAGKPP
jgi:SSS family solute:Na+ symporter